MAVHTPAVGNGKGADFGLHKGKRGSKETVYAFLLCIINTASIMEAQHNLVKVHREVEAGRELAITPRKKIVARLFPPQAVERIEFPDFAARSAGIWKTGWKGTGTSALVDESRGSF